MAFTFLDSHETPEKTLAAAFLGRMMLDGHPGLIRSGTGGGIAVSFFREPAGPVISLPDVSSKVLGVTAEFRLPRSLCDPRFAEGFRRSPCSPDQGSGQEPGQGLIFFCFDDRSVVIGRSIQETDEDGDTASTGLRLVPKAFRLNYAYPSGEGKAGMPRIGSRWSAQARRPVLAIATGSREFVYPDGVLPDVLPDRARDLHTGVPDLDADISDQKKGEIIIRRIWQEACDLLEEADTLPTPRPLHLSAAKVGAGDAAWPDFIPWASWDASGNTNVQNGFMIRDRLHDVGLIVASSMGFEGSLRAVLHSGTPKSPARVAISGSGNRDLTADADRASDLASDLFFSGAWSREYFTGWKCDDGVTGPAEVFELVFIRIGDDGVSGHDALSRRRKILRAPLPGGISLVQDGPFPDSLKGC